MATDQIVGLTLKVDQGHNVGTGQLSSGRATRRDRYSRNGFGVWEPVFGESYTQGPTFQEWLWGLGACHSGELLAGTDIAGVGFGFGSLSFGRATRRDRHCRSGFRVWEPVFRESYSIAGTDTSVVGLGFGSLFFARATRKDRDTRSGSGVLEPVSRHTDRTKGRQARFYSHASH